MAAEKPSATRRRLRSLAQLQKKCEAVLRPALRQDKQSGQFSLEHDPQKWNPLLRKGHAQALDLTHVLIDQAIPPDR
jgi:hypothetical protein